MHKVMYTMQPKYQSLTESLESIDEVDGPKLNKPLPQKVVIVGDGGCGKTCMLNVFRTGIFPEEYFPTVFETVVIDVEVEGHAVPLELWDTAGQEDYDRLRPLFYPETDIIILCFSLANRDSLCNVIDRWIPELRYFCPGVPVLLVGTKSDVRIDQTLTNRLVIEPSSAPITEAEGRAVAEQIGAFRYVECSARKQYGIREVFTTAAMAALHKYHRHNDQCTLL